MYCVGGLYDNQRSVLYAQLRTQRIQNSEGMRNCAYMCALCCTKNTHGESAPHRPRRKETVVADGSLLRASHNKFFEPRMCAGPRAPNKRMRNVTLCRWKYLFLPPLGNCGVLNTEGPTRGGLSKNQSDFLEGGMAMGPPSSFTGVRCGVPQSMQIRCIQQHRQSSTWHEGVCHEA